MKQVQVEILELITCSATGTGMMLVKRTLTSNETKVSSSGFIEMFNFLHVICTIFNKGYSLSTVLLKNLVTYLAVLYVAVPQAETMGHIGMLFWRILGRP